ncbi:MAG: hypothetical protein H7A45_14140 [Verrucomicrobiales bacterium]|nr:hypothetical protein [Verrucomicrobiales bacterium]MCP5527294.1 hypothetical protein [Verrucomicrobiales bacterium]
MTTRKQEPEVIDVEVDNDPEGARRAGRARSGDGPPVHPLAAVVLVAVDNLWNFADWAVVSWVVTIPLAFVTVFLPAFMVQRFVKRDGGPRAVRMAGLLGVLAAVPYSLFGTSAGLALLAWSGLNRLFGTGVPNRRSAPQPDRTRRREP